jgi:hypothetical protein
MAIWDVSIGLRIGVARTMKIEEKDIPAPIPPRKRSIPPTEVMADS